MATIRRTNARHDRGISASGGRGSRQRARLTGAGVLALVGGLMLGACGDDGQDAETTAPSPTANATATDPTDTTPDTATPADPTETAPETATETVTATETDEATGTQTEEPTETATEPDPVSYPDTTEDYAEALMQAWVDDDVERVTHWRARGSPG